METNAKGTCQTINDVRLLMTFRVVGDNFYTLNAISTITAPTKGVISGCNTTTKTCIYTPNAGVSNTVTNDTFVLGINDSLSASQQVTYTVNFNPLGLPSGTAGVNLNSNEIGNTINIIAPTADLSINKKLTAGSSLTSGTVASYTVTITNNSGGAATAPLTVTDTLPAGLTYSNTTPAAGSNNGWTCSASGQTVTCTNPNSLAVGATTSFMIKVNVA